MKLYTLLFIVTGLFITLSTTTSCSKQNTSSPLTPPSSQYHEPPPLQTLSPKQDISIPEQEMAVPEQTSSSPNEQAPPLLPRDARPLQLPLTSHEQPASIHPNQTYRSYETRRHNAELNAREAEWARRFNQDQSYREQEFRLTYPNQSPPPRDSYKSYEPSRPPRSW